jgi:hypothetical protein
MVLGLALDWGTVVQHLVHCIPNTCMLLNGTLFRVALEAENNRPGLSISNARDSRPVALRSMRMYAQGHGY